MNPMVSYFNKLAFIRPSKNIEIGRILTAIHEGKFADKIHHLRTLKNPSDVSRFKKSSLPYFTVSGIFKTRENSGLLKHSGLIQIDIDHVNDVSQLKNKLVNDSYVYSCFLSPTGTGIKCIIKIDGAKHSESFKGLETYFKSTYNVEIDRSCSDVSRPFFVSDDANLHFNPDSNIFSQGVGSLGAKQNDFSKSDKIDQNEFLKAVYSIPPKTPDDQRQFDYVRYIHAVKMVLGQTTARNIATDHFLKNSSMRNDIDIILKRSGIKITPEIVIFGEAKKHGYKWGVR